MAIRNKGIYVAIGVAMVALACFAMDFEHMNLRQEISVEALNVVNDNMHSTNGTVMIMQGNGPVENIPSE